jgi:ribosomal protection tetracycline resistance protein
VRDEAILLRYQNQVRQTIPEALKQGLYGWNVTDLKITLIEGEHHVMHTHPLDFVVATPMAIMDGLVNTGTTLLEPILRFRITVPEDAGSKVIGDIIHMRGEFDSPVTNNGTFTVEANIPAATSLDYSVRLGSVSGGRGTMTTRFAGYSECPLELGATATRRGINPLDQSKYILSVRKAL